MINLRKFRRIYFLQNLLPQLIIILNYYYFIIIVIFQKEIINFISYHLHQYQKKEQYRLSFNKN